jgi:hypothetical protein
VARIAVAVVIVAAVDGLVLCGVSTRTANPISSKGLGFEGVGEGRLSVGDHAVFVGFLVGRSLSSRATVTGYTLPHIPGVRLALYAVPNAPHESLVGVPTATATGRITLRPTPWCHSSGARCAHRPPGCTRTIRC